MGTQANNQAAPLDGEDFFAKASAQPQASSFSLPNPPEWMKKQTAVSFGFGGKVISVNSVTSANDPRRSTVKISNFVVDDEITSAVRAFSKNIQEIELTEICETRVEETFDNEKKDWEVIKTLVSNNPRKELINSLGFLDDSTTETITQSPLAPEDKKHDTLSSDSREQGAKNNRLSSFFDRTDEDDNFLADLASTKRAKTNNPFQIYADSESTADKQITRALMLGQFDKAMQVCLEEDRLSDAFMIAVCGGKSSIEKVQQAYFKKQASGPRYLRLLASVVGKNLWDVVYNADLANWKEVMATLCTYASSEEFPDLCESLGDRLEEQSREGECQPEMEQSASFCYIAGSKLEKVVPLWIAGLEESQKEQSAAASRDNSFSIHARGLQRFVEKVTVFRKVTQYQDTEQSASGGWKLAPLYEKYLEYADIVAAQGQLDVASEYLDLLPSSYPAADVARNRVKQATKKTAMQPGTRQATTVNTLPDRAAANTQSAQFEAQQAMPAPSNAHTNNPYAPSQAYYRPNDNRPSGGTSTYMPSRQSQQPITRSMIPPPPMVGAPPSTASAPPSKAPPSKSASMSNWNDTPDDFFKPPSSRRGTPAALTTSVAAPFPGSGPGTPPASNAPFGNQGFRTAQPAPPPPRGPAPPQRTMTPGGGQMPERPSSTATNAYAPQPGAAGLQQPNVLPQISRGPSPYNVPPPSGGPPPGSRYAPAPAPAPGPSQQQSTMNAQRPPPPPNPYAARPAPPTSQAALPPMGGPPRGTTPSAAASTPPPPAASKSAQPKYRKLYTLHHPYPQRRSACFGNNSPHYEVETNSIKHLVTVHIFRPQLCPYLRSLVMICSGSKARLLRLSNLML
jgi:protein transport protein SEC31